MKHTEDQQWVVSTLDFITAETVWKVISNIYDCKHLINQYSI